MDAKNRAERSGPAEISIVYVFDARRERVYQSWLEPPLLSAWFAPDPFRVTHCEVDARPGGRWRVEYRADSGEGHSEYGKFQELSAPDRLVFTLTQADAHGHVGPETTVTVTFEAKGEQTQIRFLQTGFDSPTRRDSNTEGWLECFEKLARAVGERGAAGAAAGSRDAIG